MPAKGKTITLDNLDAPNWFLDAAAELQPAKPRWYAVPPEIALRNGDVMAPEAAPWIVAAFIHGEKEAIRHDLVDLVKRHAQPASLDAWMEAILTAWIEGTAPDKDLWVLSACGYFGGPQTVEALPDHIRKWTRAKKRLHSMGGVDALGKIGSAAAIQHVHTLSIGLRDHSVADEADRKVTRQAEAAGTTREEFEDRNVPTCGLDARGERWLDFGPRRFQAVLAPDLSLKLRDQDGRVRASLPPANAKDDPELAAAAKAAWTTLRAEVKRVIRAQLHRLEEGMITGRPWTFAVFRDCLLANPIASRAARLFIWETPASTVRVTEDLTLANAKDETITLADDAELRVAHPLRLKPEEFTVWGEIFTDYRMVQPFPQLAREIFRCEPSQQLENWLRPPAHAPIKAGAFYGILDNDGWRLDAPNQGVIDGSWKPFPAENVVAMMSHSGLLVGRIGQSGDISVGHVCFRPGTALAWNPRKDKLLKLGQVPPVAFSEVTRRLKRLTPELGTE